MTETNGVTFDRCPDCGAVAWPDWPMAHRPTCPQTDHRPTRNRLEKP